jgi:hypothetical protein
MEHSPQMGSPEKFNLNEIDKESWEALEKLLAEQQSGSGEQNDKWAEEVISVFTNAAAARVVSNQEKGM